MSGGTAAKGPLTAEEGVQLMSAVRQGKWAQQLAGESPGELSRVFVLSTAKMTVFSWQGWRWKLGWRAGCDVLVI